MHLFKAHFSNRPISAFIFMLGLSACEREVYTTWNCISPTETKMTMVLRKAQMEFKEDQFKYCGSLGNQSFFDQQCQAQTSQSSVTFTPSTGLLVSNGNVFQCTAL